tara:strand:+ start:9690 stop:10673 length:984 start_codon:yes stop_codon:yes gene_type:complete
MAMGIIIILSGMILVTIRGISGSAKKQKTIVLLQKMDSLIKQGLQEFDKHDHISGIPDVINNNLEKKDIEVIGRKYHMRLAFPQNFAEATTVNTSLGKILLAKQTSGQYIPASNIPKTESAELAYLLFTEGSVYGVPFADSDSFGTDTIKDTDGDGLMEFVDAWGEPLRFYRWPTRLIRPNGYIESAPDVGATDLIWRMVTSTPPDEITLRRDPDDYTKTVYGRIIKLRDRNIINLTGFFTEGEFPTANTYHTFLIVSSGPDQILALEEPSNVAEFGRLARPTQEILDILMPGGDPATINDNKADKLEALYETGLADNITNLMQLEG